MEGLSLDSTVARNAEIVTADMEGETVMMSIENGKYYNLGKMGTVIWGLLENPLTVEALICKLLDVYDVERERCERETLSFLRDLLREGIVAVR